MPYLLLVESDPSMRAVFRCALAGTGMEIYEIGNAQQALTYLRTTTIPHIILVSNAAPGRLSGMPMAQFLTAVTQLTPHHSIILASTLADGLPAQVQALVKSLHIPVVKKPCDHALLAQIITSCAAQLASSAHAPSAY